MTLEEFLRELRSAKAQDKLEADLKDLQSRMALLLSAQVSTLSTRDGALLPDQGNVVRAIGLIEQAKGMLRQRAWTDAVTRYINSFDTLHDAVVGYAGTQGNVSATMLDAIRIQYKQTTARYLTSADTFNDRLWSPLVDQMVASVATGVDLKQAIENVQQVIVPDDVVGPLERIARAATENAQVIYKRASLKAAADEIGAQFYLYQGKNISTTRPFCKQRAGHVWHRKEIEEWASEEWSGKTEGTNAETIFIYVGGYYGTERSCRHVLVPVPLRDVPREDLERMRANGLV